MKNSIALALIALSILLGGIVVAETAFILARNSKEAWVLALPPLAAYLVIVIGVFVKDSKAPIAALIKEVFAFIGKNVAANIGVAAVLAAVATSLALYLYDLSDDADGVFSVLVLNGANIPENRVQGVDVTVERLLPQPAKETTLPTNAMGIAAVPAMLEDVVTVRIRDPERGTFIVDPKRQIGATDLADLRVIDLKAISDELWVADDRLPKEANYLGATQLPLSKFKWSSDLTSQVIGDKAVEDRIAPFGVPQAEIIVRRDAYVVGFSPGLKLARWAASTIDGREAPRRQRDVFRSDPNIDEFDQAKPSDYSGFFDRGNLIARTDIGPDPELQPLIYYMSVIVPQTGELNRSVWSDLEKHTRGLRTNDNQVFVVRGPVYMGDSRDGDIVLNTVGESEIVVPTHYFQVTAVSGREGVRLECFVVPNLLAFPEGARNEFAQRYSARLADIESATGLTFFPGNRALTSRGCQ